jgi:hypothetical protein
MPYIDTIVQYINTGLSENLNKKAFLKGRFAGIAELLPKEENDTTITIPALVDNNGHCEYIGVDDNEPFRLYHRILTLTNEDDGQLGDNIWNQETANMVMIVYGDRKAFQVRPEQISSMINAYLIKTITVAQKTSLNLHTVDIQASTTNLDSVSVFNQEFSDVKYNLVPERFLFAIPYAIRTTYEKSCFEIC